MRPAEFRRLREQLGFTQQELADALHTTRMSITRYECGTRSISGVVETAIKQLANRRQVLMAGLVAAGAPIEPVMQAEEVDVPSSMLREAETFALRVKGESMKDEGILPGDLIVVRKQSSAREGQIVVALVNNEATVKRFAPKKTHIELHPANTEMLPIHVGPEDEFRIEGVVVGVIRHYL